MLCNCTYINHTALSNMHCYRCVAQERLARMFPEFAEAVEDGERRWEGSAGRVNGRREAQGSQGSAQGDKCVAGRISHQASIHTGVGGSWWSSGIRCGANR